MKHNFQLVKFFMTSIYTKPQQPLLQVMLLIAVFYLAIQYLGLNGMIYFLGTAEAYLFYNVMLSNVVMYVLTAYFATSIVYSQRDFLILAGLPILSKEIVIAKLISGLALPSIVICILHIPTIVIVLINYKLTVAIKFLAFLPLMNLFVALSLLFVLSILSRWQSQFSNALLYLSTRFSVVLMMGLAPFVYFLSDKYEEMTTIITSLNVSTLSMLTSSFVDLLDVGYSFATQHSLIKRIVMPYAMENSVSTFLLLLIICIVLFLASVKNVTTNYYKNGLFVNSVEHKSKDRLFHVKSSWGFYLQREYWVIQSEPYFMMQVLLGLLLSPIFTGIYLALIQLNWGVVPLNLRNDIPIFAYMILCISCVNNISGTPYSREGVHFTTSMALPLDRRKVFLAKVTISSFISALSVLFSYGIYLIVSEINIVDIFYLFITLLLIINYNLVTPIYDMRHPLLNWKNPSEAVKTNPNVLISLLYGFPLLLLILIIHFTLLSIGVSQWVATSVMGILALGSMKILLSRVGKYHSI
ncbi:hypothetical protein ACMGD3_12910 [Lysinibacillus sphaericus]|uniref:hypothetical protein n=1 Tax=Lysinibacillus sphaericus TaxID=1421 RepID=UPI003F7930D3